MRSRVSILLAMLLLLAGFAQGQLRFSRSVALSSHVGYLCWNSLPAATEYQLFRHFPGSSFVPVATLRDTLCFDTLTRTLCADTVTYFVRALLPDTLFDSPAAGIFFQDNLPTAPCALRTCTVDTALRRVRLTWYPSADTDILGYYICRGFPCMEYDTVWGRLSTSYLCPADLDPRQPQRFRILAFDSCFQASPLTSYYSFPVLEHTPVPCDYQHLRFRWQPYYNMPDSVSAYRLFYRLAGDTALRCHTLPGSTPADGLVFDTVVDNYASPSFYCYLRVDSRGDSLQAFSLPIACQLGRADTARYVELRSARYDETLPSVTLAFAVDTLFRGDGTCLVERCPLADTLFQPLAVLQRSGAAEEQYADCDIRRTDSGYLYRIGVPDDCGQQVKYSDTLRLLFPPVEAAGAFFPNIILAGHPDLGRFCPRYLSPLAQDYSLDIFNRFGIRCFHTDCLDRCWEGTDASGAPLPQGAYLYHARCRHADGTTRAYTGTVLLIMYKE